MKPPFTLLVVHGDGSRVLRLSLPRWMAYGTLGSLAGVLAAAVGLSGQSGQVAELRQRVDDQRELIGTFETRVATVRSEIMAWKAVHSKMWEALGPEAGLNREVSGVGGASSVPLGPPPGVELRPWEELDLLASSVAEEGPRLRELEHVIRRTGKIMNALPLAWPVRGPVNSEFGMRPSPWTGKAERHDGLDIGTALGTPVESPAAATVVVASAGGEFGKHVMLDHGNGVKSLYGHLKKLDVKAGQRVEKGDVIGLAGSTGRSTGPHLHYEILVQGKPVDPRGFLWDE